MTDSEERYPGAGLHLRKSDAEILAASIEAVMDAESRLLSATTQEERKALTNEILAQKTKAKEILAIHYEELKKTGYVRQDHDQPAGNDDVRM